MNLIRLLIVSDDPYARAGLVALLRDVADCQVVGQVASPEIMENGEIELDGYQPDLVLWDLGWENGRKLPEWQDVPVPLLVLLGDNSRTADLWRIGVRAMIQRETTVERLETAVHAAAAGFVILDPTLLHTFTPLAETAETTPPEDLTPREQQVLHLLVEGLTNKAIAHQLDISEHTVKFHVNALMNKLGAQSRTEAVVRATRLGFISL